MKKHLIASAIVAAFAVPAVAQNVSISGRIDTSIGSAKDNAGNKTARVQSSVLDTNQIVIAGAEDLGGGLKAEFNMTSGFSSDASNETIENAATATDRKVVGTFLFGNRGMQVGLTGSFGAVHIGRTTGTMLNSITASGVTGNIGNLSTLNARPDNMVSYTTPTVNGFTGRLIYAVGGEVKPVTNKQVEYSLQYASGPLLARVARANYSDVSVDSYAPAKNIFGSAGSATLLSDKSIAETGAQVNYDLGMAVVNVRLQQRSLDDNPTKDFTQVGAGVSIPVGSGLTVNLDYMDNDSKTGGSDYSIMSGTLVKSLSKRTNAYVAVVGKSLSDPAKKDERLGAVGVRHTF